MARQKKSSGIPPERIKSSSYLPKEYTYWAMLQSLNTANFTRKFDCWQPMLTKEQFNAKWNFTR